MRKRAQVLLWQPHIGNCVIVLTGSDSGIKVMRKLAGTTISKG